MLKDNRYIGLTAAIIFLCQNLGARVCLNEIGYYIDSSGDTGKEWIEIHNSGPQPCDLSGWDLYPGRSPHYIFPEGFILGPGCFVVVHLRKDGIDTERDLYEGTAGISSNMPNSHASVALFTSASRDTIVDFMQYGSASNTYQATAVAAGIWTAGEYVDTAACGWSLGLKADGADSNRMADWQAFPRPTPGYSNRPPQYDVEIVSLRTEPASIASSQMFQLIVGVSNSGLLTPRRVSVILFEDSDRDSLCESGERLWESFITDSLAGEQEIVFNVTGFSEGQYPMATTVSCSLDGLARNNYRSLLLTSGSPVVINEIMYAPPTGQAEWVEIYNRSGEVIAIDRWTFEDASEQPRLLDTLGRSLEPGQYAIITSIADQPPVACLRLRPLGSWPSLNNDGDVVIIRDGRGAIVDRVEYHPSWGGTGGRSLERINPFLDPSQPSSWGGCVSDYWATPGARNSIYAEAAAPASGAAVFPNPFSPDGDGYQDHAVVSFRAEWRRSVVTVKIYDRTGRLVATPAVQREMGREGSLVWNGRDGQGRVCPLGLYIVLVEVKEYEGTKSFQKKLSLALAGRL